MPKRWRVATTDGRRVRACSTSKASAWVHEARPGPVARRVLRIGRRTPRMHRGELTTRNGCGEASTCRVRSCARRPCSRSRRTEPRRAFYRVRRQLVFSSRIFYYVRIPDIMSAIRTMDSCHGWPFVRYELKLAGAAAVVARRPRESSAGSCSSLHWTASRDCETTTRKRSPKRVHPPRKRRAQPARRQALPPDDLSGEAENRSRATGWAPGHRCSRWVRYPPPPVATPD